MLRRLQIGIVGVCAVLLLVGVASMAINRASNEAPVSGPLAGAVDPTTNAEAIEPKEPLAELGVTPATAGQEAPAGAKSSPQPSRPAH